jgi:transposase
MSNNTILMSKIRQILRLYTNRKGTKHISTQTGIARNTVKKYISKFIKLKISFEEINEMDDFKLNELFGKQSTPEPPVSYRYKKVLSFFPYMDKEMKKTGVTQAMMWQEYIELHPEGYLLSQFNHHYRGWLKRSNPSMHIQYKAGDKMLVDYAGAKLPIVNNLTGELIELEVFVAILGASQLTYVQAIETQQKIDFITCCENAIHFFGGVPAAIVPDNLKAAVTKSNKYEPTINETFADFAEHYGTSILPARAYRPKDKALVEGAVKIAYTRIYANLRNETFFTIEALNEAIWKELELHNTSNLKGREYSRLQQFNEVEKNALGPLPEMKYEFKQQMLVTVLKNGHICLGLDKHYYSVPYQFIGRKVKIIFSQTLVEIYYDYNLIANHKRIKSPYNYTTNEDHLASAHKFLSDWTPPKFLSWAEAIGHETKLLIYNILDKKQHPEQAYKSCIGVLSLAKKVGNERLNNACKRALSFNSYNYMAIQSILEKGLDLIEDQETSMQITMPLHENIRGEEYYE